MVTSRAVERSSVVTAAKSNAAQPESKRFTCYICRNWLIMCFLFDWRAGSLSVFLESDLSSSVCFVFLNIRLQRLRHRKS